MNRSNIKQLLYCAAIIPLLSACQVIKLQQQNMGTQLSNHLETILTSPKLSGETSNLLVLHDQSQAACIDDADRCVMTWTHNSFIDRAEVYSAASELYLAYAQQLERSSACHAVLQKESFSKADLKAQQCIEQELAALDKSIRYSYMYLFRTSDSPQSRVFSIRQSQVRTFYNYSLSRLMTLQYLKQHFEKIPTKFNIADQHYAFDFKSYPSLEHMTIGQFRSSYNMKFQGLYSINRRDGFGAEFVVVRKTKPINQSKTFIFNPEEYYKKPEDWNIYFAKNLPVTVIAEPQQANVENILTAPFVIRFFDPYQEDSAVVEGERFKITGNFSVPYGLWLSANNFGMLGYKKVLNMGESSAMPHLFMIEPYQPNKKVIVLIHGLASSPEAWVALTNNIMGDKVLRENYQVWQIFYTTNMPIWESRYQIHALLKQAFSQTSAGSPSSKDAVLIGHSMGGIISRLLVSDRDIRAAAIPFLSDDERKFIYAHPSIVDRFQFDSINNFSRAVFVAAPHRGTEYADRWFTRTARKMIRLPGDFFGSLKDDNSTQKNSQSIKFGVATIGPNDLSNQSTFMQLTQAIEPTSGFKYHSIMGNHTQSSDPAIMSDGIVPYKSSHLDHALSEKVIQGGHSIQESPEAVHELQRILRVHLQD